MGKSDLLTSDVDLFNIYTSSIPEIKSQAKKTEVAKDETHLNMQIVTSTQSLVLKMMIHIKSVVTIQWSYLKDFLMKQR